VVLQCLISHHTELGGNRSRTVDIPTDGYQEISVPFFVFLRDEPKNVASGSSLMALRSYCSICQYGLLGYFLLLGAHMCRLQATSIFVVVGNQLQN
jgi:hypothetical protein